MEWLQTIAVIVSVIAAVVAWVAKIRWSQEYSAAKQEIIRSKDMIVHSKEAEIKVLEREIEGIRELNPVTMRAYFLSMREHLEEYNKQLQGEVEDLKKNIADRDSHIFILEATDKERSKRFGKLLDEKKSWKIS